MTPGFHRLGPLAGAVRRRGRRARKTYCAFGGERAEPRTGGRDFPDAAIGARTPGRVRAIAPAVTPQACLRHDRRAGAPRFVTGQIGEGKRGRLPRRSCRREDHQDELRVSPAAPHCPDRKSEAPVSPGPSPGAIGAGRGGCSLDRSSQSGRACPRAGASIAPAVTPEACLRHDGQAGADRSINGQIGREGGKVAPHMGKNPKHHSGARMI